MRHRHAGWHLGRDTAHRLSLYRNLVTDLLRYERITTTEAKAKAIRPIAEKMITLGRRGGIHARRQALQFVFDPDVVARVFDDIGPRMAERPGGYLRITKLEMRKGDAARMATIELVDYVQSEAPVEPAAAPRPARRGLRRRRAAAAAPPGAVATQEALGEDEDLAADEDAPAEGELADTPDEPGPDTTAEVDLHVETDQADPDDEDRPTAEQGG